MKLKIQKLREAVARQGVNLLVYGPTGVGKTHLVGTLPENMRVLVLNADQGLRTLVDLRPDIDVVPVESIADMNDALDALETPGVIAEYDCVVVDSLSEYAQTVLAEVLPQHKNGMQAYGELGRTVSAVVSRLKRLPVHILATASEGFVQDDDSVIDRAPDFPGKMLTHGSSAVAHAFDYVFQMRVKRVPARDENGQQIKGKTVVKHVMRTGAEPGYVIKSRTAGLDAWHRPDMTELLKTLGAA